MTLNPEQIRDAVRLHYGEIAAGSASCGCGDSSCCSTDTALYTLDLHELPDEISNFSLGCGDPITLAALQPGQTVLDLGSGGGMDCFLAARRVGPTGHVIGVDMTPTMLEKANRNKEKLGLSNVEFRQGLIEALPVDDEQIDVVISNCVVNLSPDKEAVFREAYRVLRPGGKLAISDMVTQGKFNAEARSDAAAWAACVTGAEDVADYVAAIRNAGFTNISIRDKAVPHVELVDTIALNSEPRLFSAHVTAVKPAEA